MKFFVPINKESIRKNPNGGRTKYFIAGRPIVKNIVNHIGKIIGKQIAYDMTEVFNLTPEPSYLYDYEDIEVECEDCGAKFSYKELKDYYDDYCAYITNICPKCNSGFCCEVEFEKLTPEVLKNVHVQ